MQRIPQLPKWCLTSSMPAFYDYESLSAIDQTARLYATIQELIESYNEFANGVNLTIETFVNDVNSDQEEFENKINKIVHDYIVTIDTKIAHQDRQIQDAIDFMKTNLDSAITEIIAEMREMGELDESILDAVDGIGTRVSNLENINYSLLYNAENEEITLLKEGGNA